MPLGGGVVGTMNALLVAATLIAQSPTIYVSPILAEPIFGAHSISIRILSPERGEIQLLDRLTPVGKRPSRWRQRTYRVRLTKAADGLYAADTVPVTIRLSGATAVMKFGGDREIKLARMRLQDTPVRLEAGP